MSGDDSNNIMKIIIAMISAGAIVLAACISGYFLIRSEEIKQGTELTKVALASAIQPSLSTPIVLIPTVIPTFTPFQQSTIALRCTNLINRADVQTWAAVGSTERSNVQPFIDQYQNNILSQNKTLSGFLRGDPLWAGLLLVTDFGNGESESYLSYPVTPIVHYRSWGLFEVTGNFVAPNSGWCATIVP